MTAPQPDLTFRTAHAFHPILFSAHHIRSCCCASLYHSLSLFVQVVAIACVGVLVDDSVLQMVLFCGLFSCSFVLLVVLNPFANR